MLKRLEKLLRERDGQALIEMAAALPLFLLMAFGVFEYSIAMANYCSATFAVREAARFASLHSSSSLSPATTAQIEAVVNTNLYIQNSQWSIPIVSYGNRSTGASGGNYVGDLVGVGLLWNQNSYIPFYGQKTFYVQSQAYRVITR